MRRRRAQVAQLCGHLVASAGLPVAPVRRGYSIRRGPVRLIVHSCRDGSSPESPNASLRSRADPCRPGLAIPTGVPKLSSRVLIGIYLPGPALRIEIAPAQRYDTF
jgi:hypothetical protein